MTVQYLCKVREVSMTSNVLPLHFSPSQASSSQNSNLTAISCIVKFICWKIVNLSYLYLQFSQETNEKMPTLPEIHFAINWLLVWSKIIHNSQIRLGTFSAWLGSAREISARTHPSTYIIIKNQNSLTSNSNRENWVVFTWVTSNIATSWKK